MQTAKNSIKDRIVTAVVLVAGVLIVGLINNFWLMWAARGIVYLLAFHEAMRLFRQGRSVADVCQAVGRSRSTVSDYLAEMIVAVAIVSANCL